MVERKLKVKICLVGDSAVGKTSLIKKFVLDIFDDSYITTIGTKITKKSMHFNMDGKDIEMDMMIWDIMGQASFRSLLQDAYFYGAHGVLAVCDATRPETANSLHDWMTSTQQVVGEVPAIFLANKCDLEMNVTQEQLNSEVSQYGGVAMFSSAKTGQNVAEAFHALGEAIIDKYFPEMKE